MSKARRRRRLLQLSRAVARGGWVGRPTGWTAYRRAWRRVWWDLNGEPWHAVHRGQRTHHEGRSPWVFHRRRPLPSGDGKIREV